MTLLMAVVVAAVVLTGAALRAAHAGSPAALYDVDIFLRQPHPFLSGPSPAPAVNYQTPAQPTPPALGPATTPGTTWHGTGNAASPQRTVAGGTAPAPRGTMDDRTEDDDGLYGVFSEVRLGFLAHDTGPFSDNKEDGVDINLEILFTSPDFLDWIWSPRPHLGGNFHSEDETHQAYFGLTWEWEFIENAFIDFSLGGAYHTGENETNDPDRKPLGCSLLFRESIDLGYRFAGRYAVMAHFSHISNANLCDSNEGMENVGVRLGYLF